MPSPDDYEFIATDAETISGYALDLVSECDQNEPDIEKIRDIFNDILNHVDSIRELIRDE